MEKLKHIVTEYLDTLRRKKGKLSRILGYWSIKYHTASKNENVSREARGYGDVLFNLGRDEDALNHKILHCYNESIAFVPKASEELALAYGNKSALLRRMRKYNECITEIDKALKISETSTMKVKLLCRKVECLTALGSPENRGCLEKARFIVTKFDESEIIRKKLNKLIARAQATIDADKLDIPKMTRKMEEVSRIIQAESLDIWDSIEVGQNEKYGEHLIAARDFEPGEIVMVKKAYVNHLDESKRFIYCSHCWHYLWTAVPCDHCSIRLFCSEECKIEAVKLYHDIECSIMIQMVGESLINETRMIPFVIRAFARMLKEAGSINQLQKDVQFIDECQGGNGRDVLSSTKGFKDYQIIYSLPICNSTEKVPESYIGIAIISLLAIAKYSSIFNTTYEFNEIDKLMKNNAAVFVGAVLFKLLSVMGSKCEKIPMVDPSGATEDSSDSSDDLRNPSLSLRSLEYLTVFSCVPNIQTFKTYKDRHVTYALSPIKKGSPLVSSTLSIYDFVSASERQATYQDSFGRSCDCQACVEDWSAVLQDDEIFKASLEGKYAIESELRKEAEEILKELQEKSHKIGFRHAKILIKTQRHVAKSWEHFPMPSRITDIAVTMMIHLLENLHK